MGLKMVLLSKKETLDAWFFAFDEGEISLKDLRRIVDNIHKPPRGKRESQLSHEVISVYLTKPRKQQRNFNLELERAGLEKISSERVFQRLKQIVGEVRTFYNDNDEASLNALNESFTNRGLPLLKQITVDLILGRNSS